MTRTVRDAALLLQEMAGPDPRDPLSIDAVPDDYVDACDGDLKGLRVAWTVDFGYAAVDPDVAEAFKSSVRSFEDFGCALEQRDTGWENPDPYHRILYQVLQAARRGAEYDQRPEWTEPTLAKMIEAGRTFSAVEHQKAHLARSAYYNQVRAFFDEYDLLLTPQMPLGAWSKEPGPNEGPRQVGGRETPTMFDRLPFTVPFNLTGHPAISVPCGFTSDGLPVGLQIVGRWHDDSSVLRAAACFEAAQPWAHIRPPLA